MARLLAESSSFLRPI